MPVAIYLINISLSESIRKKWGTQTGFFAGNYTVRIVSAGEAELQMISPGLWSGKAFSKQPGFQHRVEVINEQAQHKEARDDNQNRFYFFFEVHE